MSDRDRESDSRVSRRQFLTVAGAAGVASLAGCETGDTGTEPATGTETPTGIPTGTATGTPSETATGTSTDVATDADVPQSAGGPLSPLPTPDRNGVARPSGDPGNLEVLDWAGFESAVSYTFDDGQPSHVAHYDELQATGRKMTFYLSTNVDFEGADEGWSQAAADGHELGNHTVSHPHDDMTGSSFGEPLESKQAEIEQCSRHITENYGQEDVWTMAGPFGEAGWSDAAEQSALFLNRGVGGGTVAPDGNADPYNLPCYMAREGDTAETFNSEIDSAHENGAWLTFLFHSIRPTDQEWYAPVDVSEITASVEHAKSAGDVWIDTVANVGAYWRGQQLFDSVTPTESGEETVWEWSLPEGFPSGQHLRVTVDGGTLSQGGEPLAWDSHGYYEVALDEGSLTLSPE